MKTKMTTMDESAVAAILMEQLGVAREEITTEARLRDDLGADSLDITEIVMKIEDRFGVTFEDEDAKDDVTVGQVHATLERLLAR